MDPQWLIGTVITAIVAVTTGYFTLRATVKAAQAKQQSDENASALTAWRELNQPLRDENHRLLELLEKERQAHVDEMEALKAEHAAVLKTLKPLNDAIEEKRKGKP